MTALRATVRLQLHQDFDFAAAQAQVGYYARLGISHYYLSPIAAACPGSRHGYDVIDPTRVNPELGGEDGLRALIESLHAHGMGAILDIVPNHMAADLANPWWVDVLARGRHSRYAAYFDIDWSAPLAEGRLWLPVAAQPLPQMMARGQLGLALDPAHGTLGLDCDGQCLPLSDEGLRHVLMLAGLKASKHDARPALLRASGELLAQDHTLARLHKADTYLRSDPHAMAVLLELQHYRLAWWRSGNVVLNYRRFFDISSLAALAVDRADVFDAVHALPLRLIAEGLIDGLRLDHIDGLSQPTRYLRRLRRAVDLAARARPPQRRGPISLHVEKILAHGESLRADWPIQGSTGYDFMDQVSAVLHEGATATALRAAWQSVSGRSGDFGEEERLARRQMLQTSLQAELATATAAWHRLARALGYGHDLPPPALAWALAELLQAFPVYRSYLGPGEATAADRQAYQRAFTEAAERGDPDRADARDWLQQQLLQHCPRQSPPGPLRRAAREARRRLEQTAAPLNAKSVEDTAFYRYGVLLSRNEVGSDPRQLALSPQAFHRLTEARGRQWPQALLSTATHDHKRGEDTRARLAALSQYGEAFVAAAEGWLPQLQALQPRIWPGDLWMLLQTLLAAWPLQLGLHDSDGLAGYAERLAQWWLKAVREAKLATRWTAADADYEAAIQALPAQLLGEPANAPLRHSLQAFARRLDAPGALNGLVTCTLRLTVPGVPDLYQGGERWDQSLVDPDNRRPVDYALRQRALDLPHSPEALLRDFADGTIKQWLLHRLLQLRGEVPQLFAEGDYRPLTIHGDGRERLLGFIRRHDRDRLLVLVPRLCADLLADAALPRVPAEAWRGLHLEWSADDAECTWRDVLSEADERRFDAVLPVAELFGDGPVAVWHGASR